MSHLYSWRNSKTNDMQQKMTYKQDGASNPVKDQVHAVRNYGNYGNFACINSQTWSGLMHAMEASSSETGQRQCVPNQRISNQSPFGDLNPNLKDNLYSKETHNGPLCNSKVGLQHNNGKSESFTSRKLDSMVSNICTKLTVPQKRENSKKSLKQDQNQVTRDSSDVKNHLDGNSNLQIQSIQTPPGFASIEVRDNAGSTLRLLQRPDYPSQLENSVYQSGAHEVVGSRPRKRKAATSALVPGSRQIPSGIRTEERTRASNMLINKVEDGSPIMDDEFSLDRERKRLILTIQLTQQLILSVPNGYFKSDATLNYQNSVYHVARSTLGEACTLFLPKDGSLLNSNNEDRILRESENKELEEKSLLSRRVEAIIKSFKKLESDFVMLDERSSVLYVKSECNELEKITIVNRLINFHGSNRNSESTLRSHMIQRTVTAVRLQMDENTPLTVPCLLI